VGDFSGGKVLWIYERIHFDPKPIDIAILGSSHAQLGLSAVAIEDRLAQDGKRVNVANFAIGASGRNIQWAIVDELYKSKAPKALILEVDDPPYPVGHFAFKYLAPADSISSRRRRSFTTIFTTSLICQPERLNYSGRSCFRTCSG
jgi:hypothetical protein